MSTADVPIVRLKDQQVFREDDKVVMEEPLEIFIDDQPYYVTMRLPGEELPLALGLCHSEGIIDSIDDTLSVNYCQDVASNRINVYLSPARKELAAAKLKQKRSTAYSSCGICGKEIVEDIVVSLKLYCGDDRRRVRLPGAAAGEGAREPAAVQCHRRNACSGHF